MVIEQERKFMGYAITCFVGAIVCLFIFNVWVGSAAALFVLGLILAHEY